MKPVIEVDDLRKCYGSHVAVDGISFSVGEGEIFGLLGTNGAGKSTTVECVQGLRDPDGGRIRVLGLDPHRDEGTLRPRIGSQLQESALPDRIKVWEALDLFASMTPGGPDWRELMEQWGLAEKRNTAFKNLSGGQRQRLLVALALVNAPDLVFLDEMTTGLDPSARRVAWDLIRAIRDNGTTVVLVTHFMDEAEKLCDRLAIFERGKIVATGSPHGLVTAHAGNTRVLFSCDEADLSWLEDVEQVRSVVRHGSRVEVDGDGPVLALVAAALVSRGIRPPDLRCETRSLEDVYLSLTGHSMDS